MSKEMRTAANFRATVTIMVIGVSIMIIVKKYTK